MIFCLSRMTELVMETIENEAIYLFDHQTDLYKSYINDTLLNNQENYIQSFHFHLNSINENIQLVHYGRRK